MKKIFESGAAPNRQRLVLLILGMIMGCLTVDGAAQSGSFPAGIVAGSGTTFWVGSNAIADYAESDDVTGNRAEYEPGDVLVVDPNAEGRFTKSSEPYSSAVMGIYSTHPGVVGRRQKSDRVHRSEEVPMAMIGAVPTKVTDEGGPSEPGDLPVTSSKPGYSMKGADHSLLTGAISEESPGHLDSGTGLIDAAVSLQ